MRNTFQCANHDFGLYPEFYQMRIHLLDSILQLDRSTVCNNGRCSGILLAQS